MIILLNDNNDNKDGDDVNWIMMIMSVMNNDENNNDAIDDDDHNDHDEFILLLWCRVNFSFGLTSFLKLGMLTSNHQWTSLQEQQSRKWIA